MSSYELANGAPYWGSSVTWHFTGDESYRQNIRAAFNRWDAVLGLDFIEVSTDAAAAIDLRLGYIDGPGNTAGLWQGTFGSTNEAVITFDSGDDWNFNPISQMYYIGSASLYVVALHEIGHAIGLDHPTDPNVVMSPVVTVSDLTYWDIYGGQQLYGAEAGVPPVATIDDHFLRTNEWSQISGWISYSDANGSPATQYEFWDSGSGASSGYFWTPGNAHHNAGVAISVAASDLANVWVRGGSAGGSETMWVRAFDGTEWSAWDSFTLTTLTNTPPVATINDHSLRTNEWSEVANWISYSDANGNAATQYEFWDSGTGASSGYFWTPANSHHAAGAAISVAASDLANVWVRGGSAGGSETMWVRAFDGTDWSAWDSFSLNTIANTPPVATISDHSLQINQWSQVSSWVTYSDANGNPATQYEFWDSGTGASSGYFWTPGNAHHAANTTISVAPSDLANVWVRGGTSGGSETMWVRAFDGAEWSAWDSFTLNTLANTPPVATISDHSLQTNLWSQVSNWISYSDANGNPATQYEFWDSGTGASSGYFWTPSNAHHAANTAISVAASDLANVWVRGGSTTGSETMWVRAFDGSDWSAWDSFTLNTLPNTPPVATISDRSLPTNQWSQVSSWINYSDANGNPATQYEFWDSGTGAASGYFWTPDNAHHAANTAISVAAASLADVWVRSGSTAGTEQMWVRAFDGADWSGWDPFWLTTV